MEENKWKIRKTAAGILDKAKDAAEKTKEKVMKTIDQTEDGEFDKEDVKVLADAVEAGAKKAASAVKDAAKESKAQLASIIDQKMEAAERERLRPIFEDDLDDANFSMTKLIRLTEMDKAHAESDLCKGSIGFESVFKDYRVLNVYFDSINSWGISFYPDTNSEIYYVDPSDRNLYISLDDYFTYLKMARINELQKIAQDLGARHFKVTFKEEKKSFSSKKASGKVRMSAQKQGGEVSVDHSDEALAFERIEVAAEMDCVGHDPFEPKLVYLRNDPSISNLIELRMNKNVMTKQKITVHLMNTSGIKVKDAAKIDAAISGLKINGGMSVSSEVQAEARRALEYEIEF